MIRRIIIIMSTSALIALTACGRSEQAPPPPAPPPPEAPGQPPPGTVGGSLESPTPGTPLVQLQNRHEALQALAKSVSARGNVTVQTQVGMDYAIEYGPQFRVVRPPAPEPIQPPASYNAYGESYGDQIALVLDHKYDGYYQFVFRYAVDLYGLRLFSTDQVALFEANYGRERHILKVAYRTPNPGMQWFRFVETYGGLIHVVQRTMGSSFLYPQYR